MKFGYDRQCRRSVLDTRPLADLFLFVCLFFLCRLSFVFVFIVVSSTRNTTALVDDDVIERNPKWNQTKEGETK